MVLTEGNAAFLSHTSELVLHLIMVCICSQSKLCQICLGWKLCTVHNDASEKSKIKCMLSENLLHIYSQFLSISALPKACNFHLCLKHVPSVSFIRPTKLLPAFLRKVHRNEITEVNRASKIFPLPRGEFICPGFIFCNVWLLFLASSTLLRT